MKVKKKSKARWPKRNRGSSLRNMANHPINGGKRTKVAEEFVYKTG